MNVALPNGGAFLYSGSHFLYSRNTTFVFCFFEFLKILLEMVKIA